MKNILIVNPKGGSGKTTLATNLAGYFASMQKEVSLQDLDRQQSASSWLKRRPATLPLIHAYNNLNKHIREPEWVITDSPAGFRNEKLSAAVKRADYIIIPLQPSPFDIAATADFLKILLKEREVRKNRTSVAMVGMRVNSRANLTYKLAEFVKETGLPLLTNLRNSQVYTKTAEIGVSIFDLRPGLVSKDIEQWNHLIQWIKNN